MGILALSTQAIANLDAQTIDQPIRNLDRSNNTKSLNETKNIKEEVFVVSNKARYKNEKNEFIAGKIFLKIEYRKLTPEYQNRLTGEMVGLYYFESDEEVVDYGTGKLYKEFVNLTGDDGETLFDLTHRDQEFKQFQLYGCNSTWTACSPELSQVTFYKNGKIEIDLILSPEKSVEVFQSYEQRDIDGTTRTIEYWSSSARGMNMNKI